MREINFRAWIEFNENVKFMLNNVSVYPNPFSIGISADEFTKMIPKGYHLDWDDGNIICTLNDDYDTIANVLLGEDWIFIEDCELMQYTGLKDKNGREIYEGDILDLSFFLTSDKGLVKFGKYKQTDMSNDYECGNQGYFVETPVNKNYFRKDIWFFAHESIVIGNIYENPELLEETQDDN